VAARGPSRTPLGGDVGETDLIFCPLSTVQLRVQMMLPSLRTLCLIVSGSLCAVAIWKTHGLHFGSQLHLLQASNYSILLGCRDNSWGLLYRWPSPCTASRSLASSASAQGPFLRPPLTWLTQRLRQSLLDLSVKHAAIRFQSQTLFGAMYERFSRAHHAAVVPQHLGGTYIASLLLCITKHPPLLSIFLELSATWDP
jgi:hypothetical protein